LFEKEKKSNVNGAIHENILSTTVFYFIILGSL